MCVSGRLDPCVCQDAPYFDNSLSRCSNFRQVTLSPSCVRLYVLLMCVCLGPCVCQDAPSFSNSLSRCSIFHQVTLSPMFVCVCVLLTCVCLGIQVLAYFKMLHPLATACQDVPSLSSGDPQSFVSSCCKPVCVWGFWVLVYARMLNPSATACQDVPCFVRCLLVLVCVCVCCKRVCVWGLGSCVCQDAPSFGNNLSRCSIFC